MQKWLGSALTQHVVCRRKDPEALQIFWRHDLFCSRADSLRSWRTLTLSIISHNLMLPSPLALTN